MSHVIIRDAPDEVVSGLVERVTFHSVESGFCVLRVKARGHRDLLTIVGGNRRQQCRSSSVAAHP